MQHLWGGLQVLHLRDLAEGRFGVFGPARMLRTLQMHALDAAEIRPGMFGCAAGLRSQKKWQRWLPGAPLSRSSHMDYIMRVLGVGRGRA